MIFTFTIVWIAVGIAVMPLTLFVTAPFGRHANNRFGPQIGNRIGWLIMESPAIWLFTSVFLFNSNGTTPAAWFLWALWMVHYLHRGLIYPFRIRTEGKKIPVLVVAFAFGFQMINGFLNGRALAESGQYSFSWFQQPVFWIGMSIFIGGAITNLVADHALIQLRHDNKTGYKIPQGKLFSYVSCPNFLGEIIQWTGWAIMCWNLAGLSFAVWTIANLVPRALAHHRWYNDYFDDYPRQRKAIFPGLL